MGASTTVPPTVPAPRPAVGLTIRPLEPSDADRLREFGCHLSVETRYRRFFSPIRSLPAPVLTRLVTVDHGDREALAAVVGDEIVAVARYDRSLLVANEAEVAVVVADAWHRRGLGRRLLLELGALAAERRVRVFTATTLGDNRGIASLLHQLWPGVRGRFVDGTYVYRLPLGEATIPPVAPLALAS